MSAGREATSVREALLAELLQDVDRLLQRLEAVDAALAQRIEQAITDACAKALLATRMNLETCVREQERRLVEAGREAAAQIGMQLRSRAAQVLIDLHAVHARARAIAWMCAAVGVGAGALGGVAAALLAQYLSGRTA